MYLDIHFDSGQVFVRANNSCRKHDGQCRNAFPWVADSTTGGYNRLFVSELSGGALGINVKAFNSFFPNGPAIDARFRFGFNWASVLRDRYPWMEMYLVRGGRKYMIFQDPPAWTRWVSLFRRW